MRNDNTKKRALFSLTVFTLVAKSDIKAVGRIARRLAEDGVPYRGYERLKYLNKKYSNLHAKWSEVAEQKGMIRLQNQISSSFDEIKMSIEDEIAKLRKDFDF